ncbi:HAMP domain-containing sensor histidine kinase [Myxococcus sp. MISCRS1]|uniref:GAF domain-containing sensor histidine kinase n=1 Tax=Myxococcus TaxID=32 RepID=UPI001CBD1088|nr:MULTISPECIES: HAMP domain-containing sensor histidine kinase [unclassified Myxococcus]MBZ4397914.1 HAMP domain-containing histidine kinase [Myxococcus sp. AS-1-15]MBZ4407525.1 HAMP domain-containing histidine kinase [Myxococcus sp. XM-1-1-1]MCY0998648.1 HAMP domain-containing sensor histidine kinase [Myxococcus sp. MISCRS1]BDT31358.1 HAMP domain-containing histidine kinase [Myxococcus sp. MH1]
MPMEPVAPMSEEEARAAADADSRQLLSAATVEEALTVLVEVARRLTRAHQATVVLTPAPGRTRGASVTSLSRAYEVWGGYAVPSAGGRARRERRAATRGAEPRGRLAVALPSNAGVLYLFDREVGDFSHEDEVALSRLARLAGLALESARLLREEQQARTEAEDAEHRAAFLSDASRLLASSSLDPKVTLDTLARLSVPVMADWCFVDIIDEGGAVQRTSVAHADARDAPLALRVREFPPGPEGSIHPTTRVARHAESLLVDDVDDAWLHRVSVSEAHYQTMREVGFHGIMSVPLVARGRSLGALTFLAVRPSRHYSQADLETAQDLARRAALFLDNARLYREARRSVLLRDEFLAVASHELKTPLTPLQLRLQWLRQQTPKDRPYLPTSLVLSQLDVVQRQVDKLSGLVHGLLDVSRMSSGRLSLHREDVDLEVLAREVKTRLALAASQAGSEVSLTTHGDVKGHWDRCRLEQVLTHLLANALKYGAGQPVRLELEDAGDDVVVRVEDAGIGIAREYQSHIFERFGRAVSERHYGGLGLGLYVTRQIVEAHGGTIQVASEPEKGSHFEVTLPRREST